MPLHIDRPTAPLVPIHPHFPLAPRRIHARPSPPVMNRRHSFHHSASEHRALERRRSHHHSRSKSRPQIKNLLQKWPVKKRAEEYDNESIGRAKSPVIRGHKVQRLSNNELRKHELSFHKGKILDSKGRLFDTRSATERMANMPRESTDQANFIMTGNGSFRADKHPTVGRRHHTSLVRKGGPVAGAGKITVHNGRLIEVTDESGHYKPGRTMMKNVEKQLKQKGINTKGKFTRLFS